MTKRRKPSDAGVVRMVGNDTIRRTILAHRIACVFAGPDKKAVPFLSDADARIQHLLNEQNLLSWVKKTASCVGCFKRLKSGLIWAGQVWREPIGAGWCDACLKDAKIIHPIAWDKRMGLRSTDEIVEKFLALKH